MKIFAWIIGLIAFLFFILSVQKKDKKDLLKYQLIANILYSVQYLFLGVYLAAIMNFISVARISTFYKYGVENKKVPLYSLIIFLILITIIGLISYDKSLQISNLIISYIPIVITLLYTISTYKNNMNVIRYIFTVCALVWMYYNFKVGAYTSLLGNIFEFSSGFVSILRYRKTKSFLFGLNSIE